MYLANERVVYLSGRIVPESDALISFRDRGFLYGEAVFDTARSFRHKLFKLKEHVDRLYRSLRYLRLEVTETPHRLMEITEEVLRRNLHLIDADDDYWVTQRVSRGADPGAGAGPPPSEYTPTVIVECRPLPLAQRAHLYRDGIEVVVPSVRRAAPDMLSPRAKTHNYLNLLMGDQEARAVNPQAWGVLLDVNGNLAEGIGSNLFLVRDGQLLTPEERFVLPGVSRQTVLDLAGELGLPVKETALDLYDAYTADEAFLTSTSLCICPIRSVNGKRMAAERIPGPVTQRLIEAYSRLLDFDFVGQYLRRLAV